MADTGTDTTPPHEDEETAPDSIPPDDEETSYCSTTSAESLAGSDADESTDTLGEHPSSSSARRRTVRTPSFSYDDLANRPRSNPRTRTPLRNPSPLLATVTRASVVNDNTETQQDVLLSTPVQSRTNGVRPLGQQQEGQQGQRVTIRINAGSEVGTTNALPSAARAGSTGSDRTSAAPTRSARQGPSHRKIRRWNNDKMMTIASEIVLANADKVNNMKSMRAADAFARGYEEREEYVMPNYPLRYRSAFDELSRAHVVVDVDGEEEEEKDEYARRRNVKLMAARDRFLRGETASYDGSVAIDRSTKKENQAKFASPSLMFDGIEPRIQSIIRGAVATSSSHTFAIRTLNAFEDVLVHRSKMMSMDSSAVLDEVLLRPVVMKEEKSGSKSKSSKKEGSRTVGSCIFCFYFDAEGRGSNNAGFHRLLLHAVCQFHGMHASSGTVQVRNEMGGGTKKERVLTVSGTCRGRQFLIVDQARRGGRGAEEEGKAIESVQGSLSALKVF